MTEAADGLELLAGEIEGAVPPGLAELAPDHIHHLAAAVAEAKHRQAAEIAAAGDQALQHVPRLLRMAIRKVAG